MDSGTRTARRVVFEETGEEREVVGACKVCRVDDDALRAHEFLLSPTGVAHLQSWDIPENTVCGHDATRADWWWLL